MPDPQPDDFDLMYDAPPQPSTSPVQPDDSDFDMWYNSLPSSGEGEAGSALDRFLRPVGQAVRGMAELPVLGARVQSAVLTGHPLEAGRILRDVATGLIEPQIAQGRMAREAIERGDVSEGLGRAAAAAIPVVGPAAADVGTALSEGNIAGAAGQAAMGILPATRLPGAVARGAARLSGRVLANRAVARLLAAQRHTGKTVEVAAQAVPEMLEGTTAGSVRIPGIHPASTEGLVEQAKARRNISGQQRRSLESLEYPVDPEQAARLLDEEAAALETVTPPRTDVTYGPSGVLDETGEMIMSPEVVEIPGKAISQDEARVAALRHQAASLRKMSESYEGGVPAGELFKQIRSAAPFATRAYGAAPGVTAAPVPAAMAAFRKHLGDQLKAELEPLGVPVSDINRAYQVWNSATIGFRRARQAELTAAGMQNLKDLLQGRIVGNLLRATGGATVGAVLTGGNAAAGAAGALGAILLGRSTAWNVRRALEYQRLARLLNSGKTQQAAEYLARLDAAYGAETGVQERNQVEEARRRRNAEAAIGAQR